MRRALATALILTLGLICAQNVGAQTSAPAASAAEPLAIVQYGEKINYIIAHGFVEPPALLAQHVRVVALVKAQVAPSGYVISVTLDKTSGNHLADLIAMENVLGHWYGAFSVGMPQTNLSLIVPIAIDNSKRS